jgi:hypothetical protein
MALGMSLLLKAILSTLLISFNVYAAEVGCFERHLSDAIALNQGRKPIYEKLSEGRSSRVSNAMLRIEKWGKPLARFFQWRSKGFQKNGIPVMCDDFVPMSFVPELPEPLRVGQKLPAPPYAYIQHEVQPLVWELARANSQKNFEKVAELALNELKSLEAEPAYHCMTRHFLESIARAARLAPVYLQKATELGLRSPEAISQDFIELQVVSLFEVARIDREAGPLQADGIPIICSDVPRIAIP